MFDSLHKCPLVRVTLAPEVVRLGRFRKQQARPVGLHKAMGRPVMLQLRTTDPSMQMAATVVAMILALAGIANQETARDLAMTAISG